MKKMIMMLSIALVGLTSCGTGKTDCGCDGSCKDSTAVVVDTLTVDSTAVVTSTVSSVDTTQN